MKNMFLVAMAVCAYGCAGDDKAAASAEVVASAVPEASAQVVETAAPAASAVPAEVVAPAVSASAAPAPTSSAK